MSFFRTKFPIDYNTRDYIDNAFIWMSKEFGQDTLIKKKVMTPTVDNFPLFKLESQKDYDKISNII